MGYECSCALTPWEHLVVPKCEESRRTASLEEETIRRAQQGDATAFERIYKLHSRRIYALCLRIVRNPAEAEDLTQEAFLRVFRKIQTFRGESAFPTWLHRLALNVVLMQLRKKNLPAVSVGEGARSNEESDKPNKHMGRPHSPQAGLIDRLSLQRAVEQLSTVHKIVFVLHDIQGYKHSEIARMMYCSVGTSKGQLHRARTRLRNLLQKSGDSLRSASRAIRQSDECTYAY